MKNNLSAVLALAFLATLNHQLSTAHAQGTAFTYQGRLNDGANPATGIYDLRFALYDADSSGTQQGNVLTNAAASVNNGLFTVTLDFGNQFPGANRWLEIGVRTNGGGVFSTLSPRQLLAATPYAIRALGAATVEAGTVINPGFIGTTNALPLVLSVNNQVAFRLQDNGDGSTDGDSLSDGAPNVIGGAGGNAAGPGVVGVTIAGGGAGNFYGSPAATNFAAGDYGTIGGGLKQRIETGALAATIAGGYGNTIGTYAQQAAIGGGYFNSVSNFSYTAVIGGGYLNQIGANAAFAVIPGGELNSVGNNAANAFAAGRRAKANHPGTFVWADTTDADFSSTSSDQLLIRATGGVGIGTTTPGALLQVGDVNTPNSQGMMRFASRSGTGAGNRYWDIGVPETDEIFTGKSYAFVIDDPQLGTEPEVVVRWDTGNLGIGTNSPKQKLDVAGAVAVNGVTVISSNGNWVGTPTSVGSVMCFSALVGGVTSWPRYLAPNSGLIRSLETDVQIPMPVSGTIGNFQCRLNTAGSPVVPWPSPLVVRIRKNGFDTLLDGSILVGGTNVTSLNTISVSAGDLISIKLESGSTGTNANGIVVGSFRLY